MTAIKCRNKVILIQNKSFNSNASKALKQQKYTLNQSFHLCLLSYSPKHEFPNSTCFVYKFPKLPPL